MTWEKYYSLMEKYDGDLGQAPVQDLADAHDPQPAASYDLARTIWEVEHYAEL